MKFAFVLAAALSATCFGSAFAADHEVKMLNKGVKGAMVFEPDVILAAPGDTVTFVPTDPGHLAESTKGMLPEGGKAFKGKAGKPVTMTLDAEGVYGVNCLPHTPMGMVALVIAGKPVNLEAAKAAANKLPQKKAKERYAEQFAQIPAPSN